jgi:hypothetical protein
MTHSIGLAKSFQSLDVMDKPGAIREFGAPRVDLKDNRFGISAIRALRAGGNFSGWDRSRRVCGLDAVS